MAFEKLQNTFNGGEIDTNLAIRTDLESFQKSVKLCSNFFVNEQGGLYRRPGTYYINSVKNLNTATRLIPFVAGEKMKYILEFGDKYIRVYSDNYRFDELYKNKHFDPSYVYSKHHVMYVGSVAKFKLSDDVNDTRYIYFYKPFGFLSGITIRFIAGSGEYPTASYVSSLNVLTIYYSTSHNENNNAYEFQKVINSINNVGLKLVRVGQTESVFINGFVFNTTTYSTTFVDVQKYYKALYDVPHYDYNTCIPHDDTNYWQEETVATESGYYYVNNMFELSSPYSHNDIEKIKYAQINDVMYLVHPDYKPRKLLHYNDNNWVLQEVDFEIIPFKLQNSDTSHTMNISENAGVYYLNSSKSYFETGHVGTQFKLRFLINGQSYSGDYTSNANNILPSDFFIKAEESWRLNLSGDWTGKVTIKKRKLTDASWVELRSFTAKAGNPSYIVSGKVSDDCYLQIDVSISAGTLSLSFSIDEFFYENIVKITQFLSDVQVKVTSNDNVIKTNENTYLWWEGSWSDKNGYPSCVSLYQDRLCMASTYNEPFTFWASKIGEYENFGVSIKIKDDDAISLTLPDTKRNIIKNIATSGRLVILTNYSEWVVKEGNNGLTPTSVSLSKISNFGCSDAPAIEYGGNIIYAQNLNLSLREMSYNLESDGYVSKNISIFASHLFKNKEIKRLAFQHEPRNILWIVFNDGTCLSVTYMKEYDVLAYSRFETNGIIEDIAVVDGIGQDNVWFIIKRKNNFGYVRNIEKLMPFNNKENDVLSRYYMIDSAIINDGTYYTGSSIYYNNSCAYFSKLYYVKEDTFQVHLYYANSANVDGLSGLGLPYSSKVETLGIDLSYNNKSYQNKKIKVNNVALYLRNSYGGKVGISEDKLLDIQYDQSVISLYTGIKDTIIQSDYGKIPSIFIETDYPVPFNILSITYNIV